MFSFWRKTSKQETTLCVLTVTSYAATGAVVRIFGGEGVVAAPVVLFSCQETLPLRHDFDPLRVRQSAIEATSRALEQCRKFNSTFDKVVLSIGEPWIMTHHRTMRREKQVPFTFTRAMIDEMVSRDRRLFEQELVHEYGDAEPISVIEISDPVCDANGYRVSSIVQQKARTLDAHVVVTTAPTVFVEALRGVVMDILHRTDVTFMSLAVAQAELLIPNSQGMLLSLGGVSSELMIIDQGVMTRSVMIDAGMSMVEDVMKDLFKVQRRQLASVMTFASDETFLERQRDIYYRRIEGAYQVLGAEIHAAIHTMQKYQYPLPVHLIVTSPVEWVGVLAPLVEHSAGVVTTVLASNLTNGHLVYAHEARHRELPLSLAIVKAIKQITQRT
jgi:hypothetical protein